jgi:hypothetical protein
MGVNLGIFPSLPLSLLPFEVLAPFERPADEDLEVFIATRFIEFFNVMPSGGDDAESESC